MIGNDIDEDLAAKEIGLEAIVVTDNLINRSNKDIEAKWQELLKSCRIF